MERERTGDETGFGVELKTSVLDMLFVMTSSKAFGYTSLHET